MCAAPFAKDLPMGRWHKGMCASSTLAVGLVDWEVAVQTLRGMSGVQRWLKGGSGMEGESAAGKNNGDGGSIEEANKGKRAASV